MERTDEQQWEEAIKEEIQSLANRETQTESTLSTTKFVTLSRMVGQNELVSKEMWSILRHDSEEKDPLKRKILITTMSLTVLFLSFYSECSCSSRRCSWSTVDTLVEQKYSSNFIICSRTANFTWAGKTSSESQKRFRSLWSRFFNLAIRSWKRHLENYTSSSMPDTNVYQE